MSEQVNATSQETFELRPLRVSDADAIARVHERCFENYFLTQLGRSLLRRYYAEFCRHPFDYGVVAATRDKGTVVAFVVGTANAQAHFRSFYRRNMHVFFPLVLFRVLTNRIVRRNVWTRMAHVRVALRSLFPGANRDAAKAIGGKGPATQCSLRLLSIAVLPESRGSGVARLANDAFENLLREDAHTRVGLSVLPNNHRAIAFYKKVGWELTFASDDGSWFEKDI